MEGNSSLKANIDAVRSHRFRRGRSFDLSIGSLPPFPEMLKLSRSSLLARATRSERKGGNAWHGVLVPLVE